MCMAMTIATIIAPIFVSLSNHAISGKRSYLSTIQLPAVLAIGQLQFLTLARWFYRGAIITFFQLDALRKRAKMIAVGFIDLRQIRR